MIGTIPSLQQAQLHARLASAAVTLARQRAEIAVKHQLRARGLKVHSFAHREIVTLAKEYLAAHPELIAEARPLVERWRKEGFFGKRAALAAQNSEVMSKDESPATQGLLLNETRAQNGAAK
jgi:hypothetical protein